MARLMLATLLVLLALPLAAHAKVLESIPSHYVKVSLEVGKEAPGQLSRALVYLDGPVLLWRGSWINPEELEDIPEPRSPVPVLLAPVRVVIPGAYKFIDLESNDSLLGEVQAETFTPEARIYRVLLPIKAMQETHKFEVLFHAGLRAPLNIKVSFEPPEGLVIRNRECVEQGISLDAAVEGFQENTTPNLVYLFCETHWSQVNVGIYAPMDQTWTRYGYGARKVFGDRGLYFKLPRPGLGIMVPETVTEFWLETKENKKLKYELRYDPPYRPRFLAVNLGMGIGYHHYGESRIRDKVDEVGLDGKFSIQGKLYYKWGLDAYGDVAGMIQDIHHSPATTQPNDTPWPAFQYWAINARIGYVEPVTPAESEWSFMGGWYWWRFYVVKEVYGLVNKLGGPEGFVQYRHQRLRQTPWWVNFRYVWLADRGFPGSIKNNEMTLGGGLDILWVGKRRPLSANIELQRLQWFQDASDMLIYNVIGSLSFPIY